MVEKGQGFTRDISSRGVYVYAESQPPIDAEIQIDVDLPPLLEADSTLRMSGDAKVIRVEATAIDEHCEGFVAEAKSYVLHRAKNREQ